MPAVYGKETWYDVVYYTVYDISTLAVKIFTVGALYYGIKLLRLCLAIVQ